MLILLALTIVVGLPTVGVELVAAMLVTPAATACSPAGRCAAPSEQAVRFAPSPGVK